MKVLRKFESYDYEFLFNLRNNLEIQTLLMSSAKPYSKREFVLWLEQKRELPLFKGILNPQGELVGLVQIYDFNTKIGSAYLSILIVETHQRNGNGLRAMSELEVEAKKMGITKLLLNVRSDNEKAIWFYIKCGFTLVKEIENFYATGDLKYNAQVFQKEIEGQQSI